MPLSFSLFAAALLVGGASGVCTGSDGPRNNLFNKMNNTEGPSAGADWAKGGKAASIYLYVDAGNLVEESGNDFGCKVAIHEYMHVLQQGFLTGQLTSLTPPTDRLLTDRFQIKNPGSVPAVFETKVKAVLDALPASLKLLPVPTYVILISTLTVGVGSGSIATAATDEIMELQFNVTGGCPGVDFTFEWGQWENNAMAEGEAEYYAENVYMPMNLPNLAWSVPYTGEAQWTQRLADNTAQLKYNNATLHIGDGNGRTIQDLEQFNWRANPVGELTYAYLKNNWRPETTHADLMQIWMDTPAAGGYQAAFATTMGRSWSQFVCDFEKSIHGITANSATACTAAAAGTEMCGYGAGACSTSAGGDGGDDEGDAGGGGGGVGEDTGSKPPPPPLVLTMSADGDLSEFNETKKISLRSSFAVAAGVDSSAVTVTVTAGSVIITATIAVPASTTPAAMQATLSSSLGTITAASTVLGITVLSVPTFVVAAPPPPPPPPPLLPPPESPPESGDDGPPLYEVILYTVAGLVMSCLLSLLSYCMCKA